MKCFNNLNEMSSKIVYLSQRAISTSRFFSASNFYQSLEIRSDATQADIKEAYYRLSMKYHPDRNRGEEASVKFRQITEAYEVLRNVKLRRLYDKGLRIDITASSPQEEEINKFYKSRQFRSRPPAPTGRTPVYDFDEWSRSHYGATLARDLARKRRRQNEHNERMENIDNVKNQQVVYSVLVLITLGLYFILRNEGYDIVKDDSNGKDKR